MSAKNNKTLEYINEYYNKKEFKFSASTLFEMIKAEIDKTKPEVQKSLNTTKEKYNIDWEGYEKLFKEHEEAYFKSIPSTQILETKEKKKEKTLRSTLTLFLGPVTEAWGDPDSEIYDRVMPFVVKAAGAEKDFGKKMNHLFAILDPDNHKGITSQERIISSLILIESLASMLNNFTESPAGFVFEGFLAALTFGKQINVKTKSGLPIEDIIAFQEDGPYGRPASLKLLQGRIMRKHKTQAGKMAQERKGTNIGGSWQNLFYLLDDRYPFVDYIVATKSGATERTLKFFKFTISRDRFVELMEITGNIELFGVPADQLYVGKGSRRRQIPWSELREIIFNSIGDPRKGELQKETEATIYQKLLNASPEELSQYKEQPEYASALDRLKKPSFKKKVLKHIQYLKDKEEMEQREQEKEKEEVELEKEKFQDMQESLIKEDKQRWEIDLLKHIPCLNDKLSESGGDTQWDIHQSHLSDESELPGYKQLGPDQGVDLSTENLEKITARWAKELQSNLIDLMTNFEHLTNNLNAFFTSKERKSSIAKADKAGENSIAMKENLDDAIAQKKAAGNKS